MDSDSIKSWTTAYDAEGTVFRVGDILKFSQLALGIIGNTGEKRKEDESRLYRVNSIEPADMTLYSVSDINSRNLILHNNFNHYVKVKESSKTEVTAVESNRFDLDMG